MRKEIPILYSTEMVKAILEGRKTMTRRVVDMPKDGIENALWGFTIFTPENHISFRGIHSGGEYGESFVRLKYGKKGDVLWVRETFVSTYTVDANDNEQFLFKANDSDREYYEFTSYKENPRIYAWKPSIHMPKRASRIWLEITDIRVERLQQITEEDALAEGIKTYDVGFDCYLCESTKHSVHNLCVDGFYMLAHHSFMSLWTLINGEDSWNANPWVWVISFKVLSTTGRPAILDQKEVAHV